MRPRVTAHPLFKRVRGGYIGAMAMSYKARKRWTIFILLIALPVYALTAAIVMAILPRMPILIELVIYAVLGIAWALPFKSIFKGVGKADPDAPEEDR